MSKGWLEKEKKIVFDTASDIDTIRHTVINIKLHIGRY
jgi:hypothetical protein